MRSWKFFFIIIFLIILVSTIFVFDNPRVSDEVPQTGNQSILSSIELDKLIKQTIKNTGNIKKYYQDTELTFEYSDIKDAIHGKKSLNMMMTAKVDAINKTLWATINSTLDEGKKPVNIEVEMYSIVDDLYINMKTNGESPGWFRSKQIISSWNKLVSFESIQKVMEEEDVLSSRSAFYKDKKHYVLVIPVKDIYTIYRILKNSYGLENQFRYTFELIQSFSDHFILEIWIGSDSLLITKTVVRMDVEVTPKQVTGMKADSARYSLQMTSENYYVNQAFVIELPEELDDAPMIYTINE
ncbi:MAG: hypothetical protein JW762_11265 [Dehalococcoidales bacterium]|nr:hypothetical protein [Dehalococcoidales bacterium]